MERLEHRQPRSAQPEHLPATESRTRDLETVVPDLVVAPDPLDVAAAEELLDISAAVDVARDKRIDRDCQNYTQTKQPTKQMY